MSGKKAETDGTVEKIRAFFAHDPERNQWSDRRLPLSERKGI
jgi:hypothetical protein